MGHADRQALLSAFETATKGENISIIDFLDDPSLHGRATEKFLPDLHRLRSSWQNYKKSKWPHKKVVKTAYDLIKKDYGDERDRSKSLKIFHPLEVADNAFRMCKLFGFDDHEATTVWAAALCHDYLERAKTEEDYRRRCNVLRKNFDLHDLDTFNIVFMLTNRDKSRPYFKYVEQIGKIEGFTPQSTYKAQVGAWSVKDSDSGHNEIKSRNIYLDRDLATATRLMQSSDPEKKQQGIEMEQHVRKTKAKVQMYPINRAFVRSKIKGLLGVEGGISPEATMVDFLLTDDALPFRTQAYESARAIGLGEQENRRFMNLIETQDAESAHDLVVVSFTTTPTRPIGTPANDSPSSLIASPAPTPPAAA